MRATRAGVLTGTFGVDDLRTVRLTLFLAAALAAALLAPVALAEDSPPGGVTAGAERSAGDKPKKQSHGRQVRECAQQQQQTD